MLRNLGRLTTFTRRSRMFMPFQTNLVLMSGFVAVCDGCPIPCRFVKKILRNLAVMYGLA